MGVGSHVAFPKRKGEGDNPSRLLDPQPEHVIGIWKEMKNTPKGERRYAETK
jgi:hypothetical protein